MAHPYEYLMMFSFFPHEDFPFKLTVNSKEGQMNIANEFAEWAKEFPFTMDTFPEGEGWVVNSHSITTYGDTLILSILLQRNRK
jgi:hypothetical protein